MIKFGQLVFSKIQRFLFPDSEYKSILNSVYQQFSEKVANSVISQKTFSGKKLSKNSAYHQEYKRSKGYDLRSMVMKHRDFIKKGNWKKTFRGNKVIQIYLMDRARQKYNSLVYISKLTNKNYNEIIPTTKKEKEYFKKIIGNELKKRAIKKKVKVVVLSK